jgi:hypothetical protein
MSPRLIIVSNRVVAPEEADSSLADEMAATVKAALKNQNGTRKPAVCGPPERADERGRRRLGARLPPDDSRARIALARPSQPRMYPLASAREYCWRSTRQWRIGQSTLLASPLQYS